MSAPLLQAPVREGQRAVASSPRWMRPLEADGYWHIPRTIARERFYRDGDSAEDAVTVTFWCSPYRHGVWRDLTDTPATGALLCGACEGRANGVEGGGGLIFRPRSEFALPKLCPAFVHHTLSICPICGGKPRYARRHWDYDQALHIAGAGLVRFMPCPEHGWRRMHSPRNGVLVCASFRCEYQASPRQ